MPPKRLKHLTKIGVEQMGDLADSLHDPEVLRLENLDTDLRPPQEALDFTQKAVLDDKANSYLPFFGLDETRKAATNLVSQQSGNAYDWKTESLISAGGLSGILNVLLVEIFALLQSKNIITLKLHDSLDTPVFFRQHIRNENFGMTVVVDIGHVDTHR